DLMQVDHRRRVTAADDDREAGLVAMSRAVRGHILADGLTDLGRDRTALEEACLGHAAQLVTPEAVRAARRSGRPCALPTPPPRRSRAGPSPARSSRRRRTRPRRRAG